jgi:hypothetical protein
MFKELSWAGKHACCDALKALVFIQAIELPLVLL